MYDKPFQLIQYESTAPRATHTAFDLFVGTFENQHDGPLLWMKNDEANAEKINQ